MNSVDKRIEEAYAGFSPEGMETLNQFFDTDEDLSGLEIFAALFALNDHDFDLIRPVIQDSLVESYNDPQVQMQLIQALAQSGISISDIINNTDEIIDKLFEEEQTELSESKKDFFRFLFSSIANALSASSFNPARIVEIPVELCRENAKLPTYATNGSAAMDIYSPEEVVLEPGETKIVPIGIKVAIPHGYALLIQPRSGLSRRIKLRIPNSPGLIDEDYHEEIGVIVENIDPPLKDYTIQQDEGGILQGPLYGSSITIGAGERFAQMRLVEVPRVKWRQVSSLGGFKDEDDHGSGFGSTGVS